MDLLEGIYSRRSQRHFTEEPVGRELLLEIVKAGTWAPSGLNNQPWRFVIVTDRPRSKPDGGADEVQPHRQRGSRLPCGISSTGRPSTTRSRIIRPWAPAFRTCSLPPTRSAWVRSGSERSSRAPLEIRGLLDLPETLDLMAVIAVGHPSEWKETSHRRDLSEVLLKEV